MTIEFDCLSKNTEGWGLYQKSALREGLFRNDCLPITSLKPRFISSLSDYLYKKT